MDFTVRYFDPLQAAVVRARLEAPSESELRQRMTAQGQVVLELRAASQARPMAWRRKGFDVGWWCRELRTLLHAGMTVVEALETLQADRSAGADDTRARIHAALLKSLREGQSLSRSMRGAAVFPEVLVANVAASERTSTLATALDDYLRYDDTLQRLKRQLVSAAIYPTMVVSLGSVIGLFLLLYVIPRFSKMYAGVRTAVSPSTEVLLWVSRALSEHLALVVLTLTAAVVLVVWAARRGILSAAAMAVVARIEPLQRQWDHFRLAKLYQSLALMFKGGYTLDEALQVCESLGLGSRMLGGLQRARGEIARGRGVAPGLAAGGLTDTVSERLLAVGERSGNFDVVLQTIADRHSQTFLTFVERATRIVEPLLLLLVALVVGGIVVMMYLPIFDIASSVR